jgi:hypothetical protein
MTAAWPIFDGFARPVVTRSRTWTNVAAWTRTIEGYVGAERDVLARSRAAWDEALSDLGGDPTARDWMSFLPLRRDREEDWSDWLAQLLEDSSTGRFAYTLLAGVEGHEIGSYARPTVLREILSDAYRADLVIEWVDSSYTHIEVKVGDTNLGKTLATAQKIEAHYRRRHSRRRSDAVLLLPTQLDAWAAACTQQGGMRERVHSVTWVDVACALRAALVRSAGESIFWRVWAYSFCGAIEQELLGLRSGRDPDEWARSHSLRNLSMAARLLSRPETIDAP